jgi:hypothetical protein
MTRENLKVIGEEVHNTTDAISISRKCFEPTYGINSEKKNRLTKQLIHLTTHSMEQSPFSLLGADSHSTGQEIPHLFLIM